MNRRSGGEISAISVNSTIRASATTKATPRNDTACAIPGARSSPNSCGQPMTSRKAARASVIAAVRIRRNMAG